MNSNQLSRIVLRGFKSIRECDLELRSLNVLIGPNGAGKSNFIGFFRLIQEILEGRLQQYVSKQGGPDTLLHFGRKKTESMSAALYFGNYGYKFALEPTKDNRMMFATEAFWWNVSGDWVINTGHFETAVESQEHLTTIYNFTAPVIKSETLYHSHDPSETAESQEHLTSIYNFTVPVIKSWRLYHFHDTSETAIVKQRHGINDNSYLRQDGRNLAAFLYFLKNHHPADYQRIVKTIQLIAPFFGDFYLRPLPDNNEQIELEWTEKNENIPFKAHHLSDGTLRFICLATVLVQPEQFRPELILIDEPELGLHPYAIKILAALLKSASKSKQIIISTQSVTLLDEFEPDDVIVADRANGWAHLQRLDTKALSHWLNEYSLGELWQKNMLAGRPSR